MDMLTQQILFPIAAAIMGVLSGWFGRKLIPKKERQKNDSELTNETISNMLNTIDNVMNKYNEVQQQLIEKSEKLLRKEIENSELIVKIEELQKEVNGLKTQIQKLIKNSK
jgi:LytS/YehU family sensor histidine kinase